MSDFKRDRFGNPICEGCSEPLIVFVGNEPGDIQAICPVCDI